MIVSGVLLDLANRPIPNGIIQIVSTITTANVLAGSVVHIKADDDGVYHFELLPGCYELYAQTSRCSDVVHLGSTVVTTDTADGTLNSIIGITVPILPPQVEQAINAANKAQLHAEQAKIERVKVEGIAAEIEQDVKEVADSVAQAESYVQSTSDNAAIAVSAKDEAIVAKEQVEQIAASVGDDVRVVEQIKHDVTELKAQTAKDVALASSHADSAEQSKNEAANSALSADAKSKEAFKYVQQAKEHAEISSTHADRAEQALASTGGVLDDVKREVDLAVSARIEANKQAVIATKAKDSAKLSQTKASSSASVAEKAEVVVTEALDEMRDIEKLAKDSIEQTANNAAGSQTAANDAAEANKQAQAVVGVVEAHASTAALHASQAEQSLSESQIIQANVTEQSESVTQLEKSAVLSAGVAVDAEKQAKQAASESELSRDAALESQVLAGKEAQQAKESSLAASNSADLAQKAVSDSQLAVVDIAKDIAELHKLIVSLHPIE